MTSFGSDNDTFCCADDEIDEGKSEYTFRIAVECFYNSALQVLTENRELYLKKIDAGEEVTLHTGAAFALEDAIKNMELIKNYLLNAPKK